jgi:hypothetical protein
VFTLEASCFTSPQESATGGRMQVKAMLLSFYHHQGIVNYEFAPEGQTVSQDFSVENVIIQGYK